MCHVRKSLISCTFHVEASLANEHVSKPLTAPHSNHCQFSLSLPLHPLSASATLEPEGAEQADKKNEGAFSLILS